MNKNYIIGCIITIVVLVIVFGYLHFLVMPGFVAGEVSNNQVTTDDYVITRLKNNVEYDREQFWKLEIAKSWQAVPKSWPAIVAVLIPALVFSCGAAWFLGRRMLVNAYQIKADAVMQSHIAKMEAREKKVDQKYQAAEQLRYEAYLSEQEAYNDSERANQARRRAEAAENDVINQVAQANSRTEETERKLEQERENNKKTRARMMEYKGKLKGKTDPPE